ncbi:MAG TPA: Fe(2+) transporter permease subunit FeoB [Cycloclasticus sp.]|jgi:ferrous iron transport protein B|nr:Fe(2+) transporter permease subunit FeoB [Cycloclasticus sp.]HIL92796.1 Fe(2+) transporter permease subunit FeoB [Cycloclasticus sp.]
MTKQCCDTGSPIVSSNRSPVIAAIGNPNCGKSTLFNAITGIKQKTGNWPGVTVERREGLANIKGQEVILVDLPGVYALDSDREALDEQIARQYILSGEADALLIVADAANLERSLFLTSQLLETGIPAVLALNMMDVAKSRGMDIDIDALSKTLGFPVIPIMARQNKGIDELLTATLSILRNNSHQHLDLNYPPVINAAITEIVTTLDAKQQTAFIQRWHALQCLEDYFSPAATDETKSLCKQLQQRIQQETDEDADTLIAATRYEFAHKLIANVVEQTKSSQQTWSDRVDKVVLSDYLGLPIFFFAIYLMFSITINFGGALIDFFDITAGAIFVDGLKIQLQNLGFPSWFQVLFADGLGGGVQVVATFIPIIATLYFCLSILEDSGYMARAAFVMDRFMRKLGLPGKAFVPLIVGFGCNVPSIMATRTLEKQRDRILTVMMAPFMSCGARLSVYALFAAAFFPQSGQNIVFLLYILGIGAAIFTALLLKSSVLEGESDGFLIELPPYHRPAIKSLMIHTWERLKGFVLEAGKFIIMMVMVINILNSVGTDGSFGNENSSKSVLSEVSKTFTPIFKPMGIQQENWPAIVGIFSGLLAKEVVVGTLDAVYSNLEGAVEPDEETFSIAAKFSEAIAVTGDNLNDAFQNMGDPLGLRTLDTGDNIDAAAAEQDVSYALFGTLVKYFDGKVGAFSYLLFILLYVPCVAAIAAVQRETGTRWAVFSIFWSLYLAYSMAVSFYQIANFSSHPTQTIIWVSVFTVGFIGIWLTLRQLGRQLLDIGPSVPTST